MVAVSARRACRSTTVSRTSSWFNSPRASLRTGSRCARLPALSALRPCSGWRRRPRGTYQPRPTRPPLRLRQRSCGARWASVATRPRLSSGTGAWWLCRRGSPACGSCSPARCTASRSLRWWPTPIRAPRTSTLSRATSRACVSGSTRAGASWPLTSGCVSPTACLWSARCVSPTSASCTSCGRRPPRASRVSACFGRSNRWPPTTDARPTCATCWCSGTRCPCPRSPSTRTR